MIRHAARLQVLPGGARAVFITSLIAVWVTAVPLRACDVPVFRYALQYWEPDRFVVEIAHYDATRETERRSLEELQAAARGQNAINIDVRVVSRTEGPSAPPAELRLRAPRREAEVRTPAREASAVLWEAPLNEASVARLVDSPRRREIVRLLTTGETAVWVLIESGDRQRDARAAALLDAQLARLESALELPAPVTTGLLTAGPITPPLEIAFTMIRVGRDETFEAPFVAALLGDRTAWRAIDAPIAVPLFGRARRLEPLRGEAIDAAGVGRVCRFLVGPCACEAKRLNPGVDLPVRADWDAGVSGDLIGMIDLDDLSGIGTLARAAAETPVAQQAGGPGGAGGMAGTDRPDRNAAPDRARAERPAPAPEPGSRTGAAAGAAAGTGSGAGGTRSGTRWPVTTLVAAVAALALVVGAATVWILRRRP